DDLFLVAVGGAAGFGKSLGFGAGIGVGNITETVKAFIGAGATVVARGDGDAISSRDGALLGNGVLINASGHEQTYVFGAAGVGGGMITFAGSAVVNTFLNDVEAYIGHGASVNQGVSDLAADAQVQIRADQVTTVFDVG